MARRTPRRPNFDLSCSSDDDELELQSKDAAVHGDVAGDSLPSYCKSQAGCEGSATEEGKDDEDELSRLPPGMQKQLMSFQADGVRFGLRRNGRLLIADEMGSLPYPRCHACQHLDRKLCAVEENRYRC